MKRIGLCSRSTLVTCFFGALSVCGVVHSADYFVAVTGSDTNPGTAVAPFREIRKALTAIVPGDTVYVSDGSYKGFDAVGLGSASKTTRIIAPGRKAVITATTDRGINNPNNILVWQCTRVVFDGLQTFQAGSAGMRIVQGSFVTVRNGVFGNNLIWGIVTSHSYDLLIEKNECYGSVQQHGIYVANSGDRPIVRGNNIHDNAGSGLRSNGDVSQGGDGIISGALFEKNVIYNNGALGGAGMNLDGLQDGIIRNNLFYNNHASGIALFKGGGAAGPKGMKVLNNTILMAADGRYNMRITDVIGTLTVRNNILFNANTAKGPFSWNTSADAAFTDSDFNVFGGGRNISNDGETTRIGMDAWILAGHEPHSIPSATLVSLVIGGPNNDYQLAANSPAIDHGITLSDVTDDLWGMSRPEGIKPDVGAYEFSSFESWKLDHGFTVGTPATFDSDGDGVALIMEYALNLNPYSNSLSGSPVYVFEAARLLLSYAQIRHDIQYAVEVSSDLQTWSTNGVDQGAGGFLVTASAPFLLGDSRKFIRLRVTLR